MNHETLTQLTFTRPIEVTPPKLIQCFNYSCLSDLNIEEATVLELLKSTIKPEEIVSSYMIHSRQTFGMEDNRSDLETQNSRKSDQKKPIVLSVERFFKQKAICFGFEMVGENVTFLTVALTNGPIGPVFYKLELDGKKLKECEKTNYFIHQRGKPFNGLSYSFTENTRRLQKDGLIGDRNLVSLSYASFRTLRMPEPYDTQCLDYSQIGFESVDHCFEACIAKANRKSLGRIPFAIMVGEDSEEADSKLLRRQDERNATLMKLWINERDHCLRKCHWLNCIDDDYVPVIISAARSEKPGTILMAPNAPVITAESRERLSILDYSIYVLSCISFWLGWSPLGFLLENRHVKKLIVLERVTLPLKSVTSEEMFSKTERLQILRLKEDLDCVVRKVKQRFSSLESELAAIKAKKLFVR